jgi:hypothetical protein
VIIVVAAKGRACLSSSRRRACLSSSRCHRVSHRAIRAFRARVTRSVRVFRHVILDRSDRRSLIRA